MGRRVAVDDEDFEGDDDWESDGEEDLEECPYCGREIPQDTPRCPYCENYVSAEDAPAKRKPLWIIVGVIVCLYIVYRWIMP